MGCGPSSGQPPTGEIHPQAATSATPAAQAPAQAAAPVENTSTAPGEKTPSVHVSLEPEPEPIRPREQGMKIIILVDSFLNRECELEIWKDEPEKEGRITVSLAEGLEEVFGGQSRSPKFILVKGKEVPLTWNPAEVYDVVDHGADYDLCFITHV